MSNPLILNQPQVAVGLPTQTYTVIPATAASPFLGAGLYNVLVSLTVNASITGNGAGAGATNVAPTVLSSGVSYVVNKNGTPVYTSTPLTPVQTAVQSKTELNCAVADVITVVFSSAQSVDNLLNTIKSTVTIQTGM